ncbi:MAG: sugar phosphate isomerase/epimerase [Nitrospirae bacterium]|nr:sugar phosphate isomerase/epimerase [Nitrospirota bacterium]
MGLDCIEWLFDAAGLESNPITSSSGIAEMLRLARLHSVEVRSLCLDLLVERPLLCTPERARRAMLDAVEMVMDACGRAGIVRVVLPFLGANAIRSWEARREAREVLQVWLPMAQARGMELHVETALGPSVLRDFLDEVADPRLRVTYDIGNSIQNGFRAREEIDAYGQFVGSVHVKDSTWRGTTVRLGTGAADFAFCFARLEALGYTGDYIIQGARVPGVGECELAREYLQFVQGHRLARSVAPIRPVQPCVAVDSRVRDGTASERL